MQFPFLLYTYLAAEILAPILASFIILTGILFLGKIIKLLDILLGYGINFADLLRLCTYISPQLLLFSIPMATMIGIILGFTRLTNDHEIMALKSAGIGLYRMLPPIIIIALGMAGLTGLLSTQLIPAGNIAMEKLLFQLAKEKIDKGLQQRRFSESIGGVVIYADKIDPNGDWQGVYVSDNRDHKAPATIMAQSGSLRAEAAKMNLTLSLSHGSLHRALDQTSQDIEFKRYTINLTQQQPLDDQAARQGKKSLSQKQLLATALKNGTDTAKGASLIIEYHKRLVLPVGCIILALLAVPLGLTAAPGRRTLGIPLGLVLFIVYYVMISAAQALSETLIVPVGPAMWLPNIIFTLFMVFLVRATARETTTAYLDRMLSGGQTAWDRLRLLFRAGWPGKTAAAILPLRGNTATGIYHRPQCPDYDPASNPVTFAEVEQAKAAGFKPCELCEPPPERKK